ncbi:glycosyl transferase group 1 [Sulfuricurvum kujiense DSM 16994]|uniref:Glycosyl transferase group 1 n=1 Tax=Sulfuricurvum kujiense (strain ATCC BAA-921 / DSM 16994 / JCM 11577 / YK-1) TaxID=709032 RepID=E4U375_SULKY|nr:glycosyltransferase [Sulfuricurvum kujiense]ADR34772.1 glycosyl transferase group 1 [Sulfuricurvum kujiense DSM 16994]
MKLTIDTQGLCGLNKHRGIGRFGTALLEEMLKQLPATDTVTALFNDNLDATTLSIETQSIFLPKGSQYRIESSHYRYRLGEKIVAQSVDETNADVFFVINLFEGFADGCVCTLSHSCINVVILYDLIPLVMRDVYLNDPRMEAWYFERLALLKKADVILSISEHSKSDAVRLLEINPKKIITIGCDVEGTFAEKNITQERKEAVLKQYGIDNRFIMYTGGIDKRKNIEGIIEAYALLPKITKETCQLLIVCSVNEEQKREISAYVQKLAVAKECVIMSGYVSDDVLMELYNLCDLFVFASLYEGFGMPILEAMRCGAPVIGSNNSSIKEIIEISEALFDPRDAQEMCDKMEKGLYDEAFRAQLRENSLVQSQKYRIETCAAKSILACKEAVSSAKKVPGCKNITAATKEKLAYISPLPGEKTGIADYSAELLFEMLKHYDVTVITDQAHYEKKRVPEGLIVQGSEWFLKNHSLFARSVYHFGNSHFHAYMFGLLEKCPGIVVSHDFYMSGAIGWLDHYGGIPGAYPASLYYSHGYKALLRQKENPKECGWEYPCNKEILDMSVGVITHSAYQKDLGETFYGTGYSRDWEVVPHLRVLKEGVAKRAARTKLGIEMDAFVICSFGFMGVHKLNEKALEGFLQSSLAENPRCKLVFVGAKSDDAYSANIVQRIKQSTARERITITGFVDNEAYEDYLEAMDIAVQLRTKSRGETSGTVLDVMAHKKATILNAHGTMNDYGEDVCVKLEDEFRVQELSEAFEKLFEDKEFRDAKAMQGYTYVQKYHDPAITGNAYREAIERIYEKNRYVRHNMLIHDAIDLSKAFNAGNDDLNECAVALAKNFRPHLQMQMFLDISELVKQDVKTGIQRVVRSLVSELIKNQSNRYRVEPVYYENGTYVYARNFTSRLLEAASTYEDDCEIEYGKGDVFVGLDLSLQESVFAAERLRKMRSAGVKISFVVYDILPVLHPEWWPKGAFELFSGWLAHIVQISDTLLCISKSTQKDVEQYISTRGIHDNVPDVTYFHLGADVANSISSSGITKEQSALLKTLNFDNTFLMVGTIEPRKGYEETLDAFDLLWSKGGENKLLIVGKQGWMVEPVIQRIRSHQELNKKLFWFHDASDELLEIFYEKCNGLLLASYAEGFGLPIIEAAKYNMPMLIRDIDVFREVAQESAIYFTSRNASELAEAIEKWSIGYQMGKVLYPSGIHALSWSQSAQWLEHIVLG